MAVAVSATAAPHYPVSQGFPDRDRRAVPAVAQAFQEQDDRRGGRAVGDVVDAALDNISGDGRGPRLSRMLRFAGFTGLALRR
jgi:hypothetical protein